MVLDASALSDHPLLAHIPVWDRESPEFASLRDSLRDEGQIYEVLIDRHRRIVDGRNRRNALAALGQPVVCRPVFDADVSSVIVGSLVNRRHLTKGALAYLSVPLFEGVLAESAARRRLNLRQNAESALSAVSGPQTAADVAAGLGIGIRLFEQAVALRRMFENLGDEIRRKYEPRILGPWQDEAGEWQDAVGLGYMINGLTSLADDAKGRGKPLGKRAQHDRLFVAALPKLSLHWDKATPEQREHITAGLKKAVLQFPAELRDELAAALKSAAKADHV